MQLSCLLCLQSRGSSHSLTLLAWCPTLSWGRYCVSQTKGIHIKPFKWSWRSSHAVWGKLGTHFPRLITHQQFSLKTSSCHLASYSFLKGWKCLVSQGLHNWFFVSSFQAPHNLAIVLLGCGNSGTCHSEVSAKTDLGVLFSYRAWPQQTHKKNVNIEFYCS